MAFDAGSIEATLTLDRSPFQAGMKLAQAQAERFTRKTYTATLDVDTREMQRSLRDVQSMMRGLSAGRASAAVGVDDRQARSALGGVRADLAAISKTRARPEIDTRSIVQATGRARLLLDGLKLIGPAAVPAAAAATGAVVALSGALSAAGVAAGAFAIAAKGAFGDVFDAVEQVTKAQEQLERATTGSEVVAALDAQRAALGRLTGEQRAAADAALELREQFRNFGDDIEPQLFEIFDDAVEGARASLESLRPILPDVAAVVGDAASDFRSFAESADMNDTIGFIRSQGIPALRTFLEVARDGAVGVGNLFEAFAPLNAGILDGIRQGAADFRAWSASLQGSPEFEEFLRYVRDNGPRVLEVLGDLAGAAISIAEAVAPLGGPTLAIIEAFADAVDLLATYAPGLIQAAIAFKAVQVATELFGEASRRAAPLVTKLRTEVDAAGTGFSKMERAAGAAGAALVALQVIGDPLAEALGNTAYDARTLAADLEHLAATGQVTGTLRTQMGGDLQQVRSDFGELGDSAGEFLDGLEVGLARMLGQTSALDAARQRTDQLDEALANMVRSGNADAAAEVYRRIAQQGAAAGWSTQQIREQYDLYWGAAAQVAPASDTVAGAFKRQADAAEDARIKIMGLMDAHLQSREIALAQQRAGLSLKQSMDAEKVALAAVKKATDDRNAAVATYGAKSKQAKAATDVLKSAELGYASAQQSTREQVLGVVRANERKLEAIQKETGGIGREYLNTLIAQRDKMRETAGSTREGRLAVQAYNEKIAEVQKVVSTQISVTATGKITVNGVPWNIASPEAQARGQSRTGNPLLDDLARARENASAAGGPILGRGTATSDSIPAYLSNGEHVLTAKEVQAAGGHGAIYAMRAALLGRRPEPPGEGARYATGGPAQHVLPPFGTSVRDAIIRSAEASRKALVEMFSSALKKAWTAAQAASGGGEGGGPVAGGSVAKALEWARTQDGKPYQWGGGGNPSWDCSGFMAGIEQVMRGRQPGRLYTTMSFRGAQAPAGWEQGLSAPFMVGVYNGPSASNSHMAGTLNGVAVESSGSNGVQVGPPARGHNNSMFTHQYGFRPSVGDTEAGLAHGGAVWGRGTATSDSVPAWLSRGEHVWTAKEVRAAGGQNVMYALRKAFGGGTRGEGMFYARGGRTRRPKSEIARGGGGSGDSAEDGGTGAELTSPFEGFAEQLQGDAEQIRTAISDAIDQIREALTGDEQRSLVKVLQGAQVQMVAIAGRIQVAQENLSRVQQMRETVATGGRELATVSGIGNVGSARDILALATQQRAQVTTFTRQLAALRRAGYARTIIEAAAGMGVEEGSEYARVLLSASAAQRRQLNAAEAAGLRAATGLGTAAFTAAGGPQYQAQVAALTASLGKAALALEKKLIPATVGMGAAGDELSDAADELSGAADDLSGAAGKTGDGGGKKGKKGKKSALKKRTYDDGGDLEPGATLAVNRSGRTESTVTDAWRARVEEALTRLLNRQGAVNVSQTFTHPVDPYAAASATVSKVIREVM